MSDLFFDTSALAKRYITETGTTWVRNTVSLKSGNTIIISELCQMELISLLARKLREGNVTLIDFNLLKNDFLIHCEQQYRIIPIVKMVQRYTQQLLIKHPLRTLDAIQLASAVRASRLMKIFPQFISADNRLLTIAAQEGFTTNPNHHP